MELNDKKFAVLVDADNISHRKIKDILDEIANYGTPTIKRIYGDFTNPKFAAWKEVLLENSITPIQQYAYTTGKNATDSALIIDAMDILHKEGVDGFCIVSSDSDYTRLASRIRESGREVLGFGEKKTPKPFIKSCDKFIYVEILGADAAGEGGPCEEKGGREKIRRGRSACGSGRRNCRGKETVAGCGARLDDHPSVRRRIPARCWRTRSTMPPTTAAGPLWATWAACCRRRCRISTPATTATRNFRSWSGRFPMPST